MLSKLKKIPLERTVGPILSLKVKLELEGVQWLTPVHK